MIRPKRGSIFRRKHDNKWPGIVEPGERVTVTIVGENNGQRTTIFFKPTDKVGMEVWCPLRSFYERYEPDEPVSLENK